MLNYPNLSINFRLYVFLNIYISTCYFYPIGVSVHLIDLDFFATVEFIPLWLMCSELWECFHVFCKLYKVNKEGKIFSIHQFTFIMQQKTFILLHFSFANSSSHPYNTSLYMLPPPYIDYIFLYSASVFLYLPAVSKYKSVLCVEDY